LPLDKYKKYGILKMEENPMKNPYEITELSKTIVCSKCGCSAESHPLNINSEIDHFRNGIYCTKSKFDVVNDYVEKLEKEIEKK
jgi:hypothetical protein